MADPTLPDPRFLLVLSAVHNNEVPFPLLDILAGDRVLFTHNRRSYNVLQGGDGCGPFLSEGLRCITWNTRGLVELSRQTPDCIGAKLLLTSTALRAYRNRHLGTLMRCCEAWKPIEECFDILSFEFFDFQRLSQIFASLTREILEARETEVYTLPWTQTEKDIALARCRNGQRAWRNKNLC